MAARAFVVPLDVLAATEQLVRAACTADTELQVTGLRLPDNIGVSQTAATEWAATRDVAEWVRDELRKAHPLRHAPTERYLRLTFPACEDAGGAYEDHLADRVRSALVAANIKEVHTAVWETGGR